MHAIGIVLDNGVETLIYIGQDIVQLEDEGFTSYINQGDQIRVRDKLLDVDLKFVESKGFSLPTPIIITHSSGLLDIIETPKKEVDY